MREAWESGKPLADLPEDKDLAGKTVKLVAEDEYTGKIMHEHTNVKKFCNWFKGQKDPSGTVYIHYYIDGVNTITVITWYGVMKRYVVGSETFTEMKDAMLRHTQDVMDGRVLENLWK